MSKENKKEETMNEMEKRAFKSPDFKAKSMKRKGTSSASSSTKCEERKSHYSLYMPDGNQLGAWTYIGDNDKQVIKEIYDRWYEATSKDPEEYGHTISYYRCPKCGGAIHCRKDNGYIFYWCIECRDYQFVEKDKNEQ